VTTNPQPVAPEPYRNIAITEPSDDNSRNRSCNSQRQIEECRIYLSFMIGDANL
jgi:hypothetical protein